MSKIRPILKAFYTMHLYNAKSGYTFEKYSVALLYKKGVVRLNGSSDQWNQTA